MKTSLFLATLGAAAILSGSAMAGTLDDVKARGKLNCGVSSGTAGFSAPDAKGVWQGFDVAICRAVAAAVLGDPMKVDFVPTTGQTRFTALASGEIDVLSRATTWTFSRDTDLKLTFAGTNFYDGQAFMVKKELGVTSAANLNGATICIQSGTTTELNLAEYFRLNKMTYEPVPVDSSAEGERQYQAGACDVYTSDGSNLASVRASFKDPADHIILPEVISKEPLGPIVRQGDEQWADIVHWTQNALFAAEELGVTKANADQIAASTENPEIKRLLGKDGNLGKMIGLDADWAKRAIMAGGNYGEIYDANLGTETPIKLARGMNAQWTKGGMIYSQPFR
ncbi:amino acid ABC transporter substrate-binding protein [Allorhizobium undicola]|uniref:amino acid ABC transporter substrate-binding protein n=1 Tax=Allorhizobium undicola TaxID=78527 RepID=UPI000481EF93|nr:amino acid ABC transporter substrate-binding protein [Allorhizobium undicola]